MMSFCGELTDFADGFLWGWAYDASQLQRRLVVEVYADDYPLALSRAEWWLPQLQTIGDGCYGFRLALPSVKLRDVSRLRAKIANSDFWLNGVIYTDIPAASSTSLSIGRVENPRGLRLSGWAWNSTKPDQAVTLSLYADSQCLGEVRADQLRADLIDMGLGNGRHGFSFTLPIEWADGQPHEIRVLNTQGQSLHGSPVTVIAYPQLWDLYQQPASPSTATPDLWRVLAQQFQRYQQYLPTSVDFGAYQDWAKCFPVPVSVEAGVDFDVLVLVLGDGDLEHTLDNLMQQTLSRFQVLVQGRAEYNDPRLTFIEPVAWDKVLQQRLNDHQGLLCAVEAGDSLPVQALSQMARAFDDPVVQLAYSDCDYRGGAAMVPWFKPDWDFDLFLSQPLLQHLCMLRSEILPKDSSWLGCPAAWPWLIFSKTRDSVYSDLWVKHIPQVLYHCRRAAVSGLADEIIDRFLPEIAPNAKVEKKIVADSMRIIHWPQPDYWPKVSLIIPTRDHKILLEKCINSLKKTDYPDFEVIVVDNDSQDKPTLKYLSSLKKQNIQVLAYPHRFNYSAINNYAVSLAQGEVIALINDDIEAINPDWLTKMIIHLLRPQVGAVGAKLLWPNGMVQHGGVLLGMHGLAGHIGNHWEAHDMGYFGYNQLTRRVSAVTAACLVCRKADYLAVGGLDEQAFPVVFNDVDFCLKLGEIGKQILWTPEAQLWHAESASRGHDDTPAKQARLEKEKSALRQRWGRQLFTDPYYNINLNLDRYSHDGLAFPPRTSHSLSY